MKFFCSRYKLVFFPLKDKNWGKNFIFPLSLRNSSLREFCFKKMKEVILKAINWLLFSSRNNITISKQNFKSRKTLLTQLLIKKKGIAYDFPFFIFIFPFFFWRMNVCLFSPLFCGNVILYENNT